MLKKKLIFKICLLVSVVVFWNLYQVKIQKRSEDPAKLPFTPSGECGIENCHGLDISCGPNIPDVCTMIYEQGDNCRQFADCQIIDGQCSLKESLRFENCKSCVEKCEKDFKDDQVKFFECESRCV
jgi:hypothetical protein